MPNAIELVMAKLRLRQLQLLLAIEERKSLHQAASILSMTQSAASKSLAELEGLFGLALFERSRSGLVPNEFGRRIIAYARIVRTDLSSLCDEFAKIRTGAGGRLSIGAVMGAIPDIVVPAVNEMQQRYPDLSIDILEDTSAALAPLLDEGDIDLIVGRSSVAADPSRYHYQTLCEEPLCVVEGVHGTRRGAGIRSLAGLQGRRWVVYPTHMPLHAVLLRELDLAGEAPPQGTISTASSMTTICLLRDSPDLVALIPTSVAGPFIKARLIRTLPIRLQSKSQTLGIVTRRAGAMSAAARHFAALLRQRASAD